MDRSSFFIQYPDFQQDRTAPILDEYYRLAQRYGWSRTSGTWKIHRRECLQVEFEFHLGSIESGNKLSGWQGLCGELGLSSTLPSIIRCKKVSHQPDTDHVLALMINLWDRPSNAFMSTFSISSTPDEPMIRSRHTAQKGNWQCTPSATRDSFRWMIPRGNV